MLPGPRQAQGHCSQVSDTAHLRPRVPLHSYLRGLLGPVLCMGLSLSWGGEGCCVSSRGGRQAQRGHQDPNPGPLGLPGLSLALTGSRDHVGLFA